MRDAPTTADLVAMAAEHGIVVTPRQVERWRNERLIPPNVPSGLGRGAGSVWLYEDDIGPRFLAAADLVVTQRRPIPEAAVRLWMLGFGMEPELLRRHLRDATRPMRRLREKLATTGPEEAAHGFLDGLRRRPERRSEWGMREWSGPERDRMAAFAEDLVGAYVGPERELAPDTVGISKAAIGITPSAEADMAAAGNDMDLMFRTAFPKHAKLDDIADDATDEELLKAREICSDARDRARMEVALSQAGASGPFVRKMLDLGFDGARGLLTAVAALRWARGVNKAASAANSEPKQTPP